MGARISGSDLLIANGGNLRQEPFRNETHAALLSVSSADAFAAPTDETTDTASSDASSATEPSGATVERYILTVRGFNDADRKKNVAAVQEVLMAAGVQEVSPLEGTPVIFVTAEPQTMDELRDSELVESVQQDRLSKPYKER